MRTREPGRLRILQGLCSFAGYGRFAEGNSTDYEANSGDPRPDTVSIARCIAAITEGTEPTEV